ncbi:hypothetical protein Gogos_021206 [Gossypium gossypioides]|uniref:DUF7745 domain-containing protein n=1 Tax=Gossypium gossypioides TaxID=34282 RepID=A0A7J9CZG7_GOSGO|nr:hypothetical protein [Gossypium gossypioides]
MDNSSTFLESKPHIVNRTSHSIRTMLNLHPLNSHKISIWEKQLLLFIIFAIVFAKEFDMFNEVESDRLSGKYVELVAKKGFLMEESITQVIEKNVINNLEDLIRTWKQWDSGTRGIFIGNLPVFHFQLGGHDSDHRGVFCSTSHRQRTTQQVYVKEPKPVTFKKKLMKVLKRVDLFALAIYRLVIFPKVIGHIKVTIVDFFKKLRQGINPVPTILAETFRSLSCCRRKGEGRFIGCAQLFNAWIFSHFWKIERTPFHMFSKMFALLKAYLEKDWPKDVTE